ncbi:MAG: glycoside-pentoside-hexuronide (GPH):cation symporter [Oscillospiraceae bacterium]
MNYSKRNRITFGLGTIGRDMLYTIVSMYLMFYLTEVLKLPNGTLWWITAIILLCRVFDAFNDPVMGVIVDNTRTRFGKFKPWVAFGAITSGICTVLLFTDFGLQNSKFIAAFGIIYLFWGMCFTTNDISYWSMMPSLSTSQKDREKIGAFARICANLGLFTIVVGITPLTEMLGKKLGSMQKGYFVFAACIVVIMWIGQSITLFGVKEPRGVFKQEEHTTLKGMLRAIFKNDQLLYTAISMALFMIGYVTTTSFGQYFFKYAYGDINMYSIFGGVLGVSQIAALAVFPIFSKRYERKTLYAAATALVVIGYIVFFFAPMNMIFIGLAGMLLFVGQAFIQLLMLMFLSDTIEYGQWKLGKRNDSVTFALQPFINKLGGAVASGIVGATVILSGINDAQTAADMTSGGLLMLKISMLVLPLLCILAGYMIYRKKYIIDKAMYDRILNELEERGDITRETHA